MKRIVPLWLAAFVLTVAFLVWQKMTGPTYPVRETVDLGGTAVPVELIRSGEIGKDLKVAVPLPPALAADPTVVGRVIWRRYPTDDPWQTLPMTADGGLLSASLPHQPMAGKLEYRVELQRAGRTAVIPADGGHAVARFKGAVPNLVLVFHVTFLVLGFLFSTAAGLEGLTKGPGVRTLARLCFGCLLVGGLILGPVVQKYAFDAYWTGWPRGDDWTDNKLAVGALFWLIAVIRTRGATARRPAGRWWAVLAMAAIFVIFAIPHSIHGSTYDYATGEHIQRM